MGAQARTSGPGLDDVQRLMGVLRTYGFKAVFWNRNSVPGLPHEADVRGDVRLWAANGCSSGKRKPHLLAPGQHLLLPTVGVHGCSIPGGPHHVWFWAPGSTELAAALQSG